jgi:hypothetical protein
MSTPETPTNPKAAAKAAKAYAKASRPWFKKKRYIALIVVGLFVVIGAASGGGGGDDSTTDAGASPTATATQSSAAAKESTGAPKQAKPVAKPTWKTVSDLRGNTNKSGPDFHLNGCDTRLTYDVKGGDMSLVAFYVMESGKKLLEDGGIPVASPSESGRGETVLREDEGDYYIEVMGANADWTAAVQEKC